MLDAPGAVGPVCGDARVTLNRLRCGARGGVDVMEIDAEVPCETSGVWLVEAILKDNPDAQLAT